MRTTSLVLTVILFCLCMAADSLGCHTEDLEWILPSQFLSDDGVPQAFYAIKGLEGFLSPYIEKGFSNGVGMPQGPIEKLGQGAYGSTYKIRWPGYEKGAIAKMNKIKSVARHEASILAYLDGAAGTPQLLAYHHQTGRIVMELVGSSNILKLGKLGLSRRYMLMLFMSLTHTLNELHNRGVVHGDLKPDNVMVSFDAHGVPKIHFIDFGLSTLSRIRAGLVLRKEDWKERLRIRSWYSAEFYTGRILDNRADFPGLAFIMRRLMPDMESQCQTLFELTGRAMAHDRNARPFLDEFFEVLL